MVYEKVGGVGCGGVGEEAGGGVRELVRARGLGDGYKRKDQRGGIREDSWRKYHGRGIMEEESWRRNHGGGII